MFTKRPSVGQRRSPSAPAQGCGVHRALVAALLATHLCPALGRYVNIPAGALQASLPHVRALCERHGPMLGCYLIVSTPCWGVP